MTNTTIDLTHPVRVLHDDRTYSLGYLAECGCGWTGTWRDYQTDAEADAVDHREIAVGPGDGLDRAMGELLDLQDDLASVVVWLAENWSADLPVPTVYGSGGGAVGQATVELSAYCEPDDLARIVHLLGVPAIDDDTPNSHNGHLYRNARRSFGRVTLRAFTRIDTNQGPVS